MGSSRLAIEDIHGDWRVAQKGQKVVYKDGRQARIALVDNGGFRGIWVIWEGSSKMDDKIYSPVNFKLIARKSALRRHNERWAKKLEER